MTSKIQNSHYFLTHNENTLHHAGVAKLADALDLGSSGATRESSSLSSRTKRVSKYNLSAGVAKLADALDLGSSGATRESSSLSSRTRCISTLKLVREWRNWQTRWI